MPFENFRTLEACRASGQVDKIGDSNFSILDVERVISSCSVVPSVNQIEFHPFVPGLRELQTGHTRLDVPIQGTHCSCTSLVSLFPTIDEPVTTDWDHAFADVAS